MRRSRGGIIAHDVVIEHAADGVTLLLGPFEQAIAAEQALFFAWNGGEEKRGAVSTFAVRGGFAEQTRGLYADRNAGSIIIRAGSVGLRVHDIGWPRVVVARDNEERFRELWVGAGKNGVNAFEMKRLAGSSLGSGIEFVDHDLQLAAGILGDFIQARSDVVAAATDAALRVGPGRKRQPSPTGNQLVDQGAHRFFVDALSCDGCAWAQQHLRMRLPLLRLRWITRGGLLREGRRDGDPETNTCEEATAQKSAMRGNAVIHRLRSGKECVQQSGILA